MIQLKTLLQHLTRPEVSELAMVSDRHPFARVGGSLEVLDADVLTSDDILQILFNVGGSRYVDSLGPKATQWATRAEGVGPITVAALMKGEMVQARLTLRNRDSANGPEPSSQTRAVPASGEDSSRRDPAPRPASAPVASSSPKAKPRLVDESPPPLMGSSETSFDFQLDDQRPPSTPASPLPPVTPVPSLAQAPSLRARRATLDDPFGDAPPLQLAKGPLPGPTPGPRQAAAPLRQGLAEPSSSRESPPTTKTGAPLTPARDVPAAREARPPPEGMATPTRESAPIREGSVRESSITRESVAARDGAIPHDGARPADGGTERESAQGRAAPRVSPSGSPSGRPLGEPPSSTALRTPAAGHHSRVFRDLLLSARNARASDLHVIALRKPLLRIGGELVARGNPLDPELVENMILERVPPRLLPQLERDGSCDFALEDARAGRFRVNVSRQRTGYKASLRLIGAEIPTLASLGLPDAIGRATHHHQGLIVLTGPTGHGKTTTLAAIVDILNAETTRHVITVEDPVEYIHPRKKALMSQREVGTHTRSFGSALKGSLREDPDVIVVGELRDTETVRAALSASETGHLVIGTMNTPSAAKTIDRLIDLFPPGDQPQVRFTLAGGLRLIVSQRLLPNAEGPGMVAAAEVLPGSTALWNLIRDNKTFQIPSLQQRGKALGIVRLDDSLLELVRSGKTTAEAALRLAEAPEELAAVLGGKRKLEAAPGAAAPVAEPRPSPDAPPESPHTLKGLFNKAGAFLGKRG